MSRTVAGRRASGPVRKAGRSQSSLPDTRSRFPGADSRSGADRLRNCVTNRRPCRLASSGPDDSAGCRCPGLRSSRQDSSADRPGGGAPDDRSGWSPCPEPNAHAAGRRGRLVGNRAGRAGGSGSVGLADGFGHDLGDGFVGSGVPGPEDGSPQDPNSGLSAAGHGTWLDSTQCSRNTTWYNQQVAPPDARLGCSGQPAPARS